MAKLIDDELIVVHRPVATQIALNGRQGDLELTGGADKYSVKAIEKNIKSNDLQPRQRAD